MSNWYRNGTVGVTNGSKVVTGVATDWLSSAVRPLPGDIFSDGSKIYEIAKVNSDTQIELFENYEGATVASGMNYSIIRNTSATVNTRIAQQMTDVLDKLDGKITVSTTAPAAGQGNDGDIWLVVQ